MKGLTDAASDASYLSTALAAMTLVQLLMQVGAIKLIII